MNRKQLILTVGLPRSGKTTWAREQKLPIVNPDSIRLALHGQRFQSLAEPMVWAIALIMVRALFMSGHDSVIVDATNVSRKRRDFWKSGDWELSFVRICTSEAACIKRAMDVNDTVIVPVIERMAKEFQPVEAEEGHCSNV